MESGLNAEFKKNAAEPEIIYEDKNFLAVNKPAGLLVHEARSARREAGPGGREPTLADWLLKNYPEIKNVGDEPETRPGIVHRLDKETSGIMLVARNQKYFAYLKSLFQNRQIKKTYLAVVFGEVEPEKGIVNKPIGIRNGTTKRSVHSEKMAKEAVTEYKVIKRGTLDAEGDARQRERPKREGGGAKPALSLLEVSPKTGRTHQIRVHLASIGHPIAGDRLYGPREPRAGFRLPIRRLMLHALALEFEIEPGRRIRMEAEPPEDFLKLFGD